MAFMERHSRANVQGQDLSMDLGLRAYMLKIYNYMGLGLMVTALVSYGVSHSETMMNLLFGNIFLTLICIFAPLGLAFYLQARLNAITADRAQLFFWVFSGLMGLSLSTIFLAYEETSIARVFLIAAGMFGGMSLYGYTTKKDLTGWGSFLIMGLIGMIIASLINLFLASTMVSFVLSCIGVVVFTGLTAYDTQRIKQMYCAQDSHEIRTKKSVIGALMLYLDFLNLFLSLLRIFGDRR